MNPFEGQVVRLAALEHDDLPTHLRWYRSYPMRRFLSTAAIVPTTLEEAEAWYEHAAAEHGKGAYSFGIRALDDNHLLGGVHLRLTHPKDSGARFSIYLGERDTWGKGYGTDATRLALRFAFGELNLYRVELDVFKFNARAIRAYEKAGFTHEAVRRAAVYREGAFHDVRVMGILRREWGTLPADPR